ncbi:helix-turn-helix domain-containing protein [Paenibacillus sp. LMG 31459]|uniref:Helix-turn-helix domain-containing protein n=1 Tax=Paenibacillus phytohabitans TaxID=2654978 RepID=A0ABX1YDQ2_9BACL|nr:AraC family transcriptional regulator [Paenibacillus phytohabitans]NOU79107.1 helix-turn-helix domain-containing protein [Paenibacillus phytohabitans]
MFRTWYRRLLLSYFPIFLLTVTILIFASFVFINDISRMETKKADRISASYLKDSVDRTIKEVELSVLDAVERSDAYKRYFNNLGQTDTGTIYAVAQSLRNLIHESSYIQSVYLYDRTNGSVLTETGLKELTGFIDEDWIRAITSGPVPEGWQPVREYKYELVQRTPIRVLTINKAMPLPFGSEGVLVINIKMSGIEQLVDSMVNQQLSFMTILDSGGNIVYQAHSDSEGAAGGKQLNTLYLERNGWTFSSGIKAGNLFSWVSVISYLWVAIAIGTVICAILYLVYVTRRNYKPIQVIMNRIEGHQIRRMDQSTERPDEMMLIDGVLEDLINHMTDYDTKSRENLLLQRSKLFTDLLYSERLDHVIQRLEELSPLTGANSSSRFMVVLSEINRYEQVFEDRYTRGDQNTLKFALMNVFQELARNAELQGWAEWVGTERAAILFVATGSDGEMAAKIRIFAEDCRSWVEQNLRISLSFGIGSAAAGPGAVRESFAAAEYVMQHKLLIHEDIALAECGEARQPLLETYKYLQMIAEFVKQFRMSSGQWREQLERIFEAFEQDFLQDDDIRSLIQAMLQMLGREVAVMSEQLQDELSAENALIRLNELDKAESIHEVKNILFEYLTDVFRTYVSVSETKSYRAMVNEMKNYIEENFTNPDLSLKHLSDRFQVSGKYASYLFKTEFKMKFVDFLTDLRMKKAEQLLLETESSLQDIALQVGYANAITFGRVFKRIAGITPGDYRSSKRQTYSR